MGAFSDLDNYVEKGKDRVREGKERFDDWKNGDAS